MRRILALTLGAVALAACGGSVASTPADPMRIVFGVGGGNMVPYKVTIERTGLVRSSGSLRPTRQRLSRAKVESLSRLVRTELGAGLKSRRCPRTNPDIGSEFIRAAGRTVTVHGSCEPRFTRLWSTLAHAVGLRVG